MEAALFVWLAGNVGSIKNTLVLFVVGFLVLTVISFFMMLNCEEYNDEKRMKHLPEHTWWKWFAGISIFISLFTAIIPSKDTLYLMAGAYFGQQVIDSPEVDKVRAIINQQLDKALE